MYTSLGTVPSNLDLFLTFQGNFSNNAIYTATHSLRTYTDNDIDFDINRDNATTSGSALICISGVHSGLSDCFEGAGTACSPGTRPGGSPPQHRQAAGAAAESRETPETTSGLLWPGAGIRRRRAIR
jgi:hypothetical protein